MGFSIFGGSKKAGKKLSNAFNNAIDATNQGFDTAEGIISPLAQLGGNANTLYGDFLGVNGVGPQGDAFQNFQESPYTQFLRDQGEAGIERSAAARGRLFSGRTLADLSRFNQGLSNQGFDAHLARLAGLGAQGVGNSTNLANLATGRGSALSNLQLGKGQASANAVLGNQAESIGLLKSGLDLAGFAGGFGFGS